MEHERMQKVSVCVEIRPWPWPIFPVDKTTDLVRTLVVPEPSASEAPTTQSRTRGPAEAAEIWFGRCLRPLRKRPPPVRMLNTCARAFCRYTRKRLEPPVVLFPFSVSLLSSHSSFSATMTMITRSVGSLCTQSSDLPECQCAWASVHSLFGDYVTCSSCKKQLSWHNCASLVPLGMRWACICAGNECCVRYVFVCVWLCQYVLLCVVCVVLLVASVLVSMRWLLCGGDGSKKESQLPTR